MQYSKAYFKELLSGFIKGTISTDEVAQLYEFIEQYPAVYDELMQEDEIVFLATEKAENSPIFMGNDADMRIKERLVAYVEGSAQTSEHSVPHDTEAPVH